jgi:hypothetical protein
VNRSIAAAIALTFALTVAPPAAADDIEDFENSSSEEYGGAGEGNFDNAETVEQICLESRLGRSPGQIAGDLQAGDGRWNDYTGILKTWDVIVFEGQCG